MSYNPAAATTWFEASTFSGADIVATISVPLFLQDQTVLNTTNPVYRTAMTPVVLGNIQTITVSTHRDKFPVRSLHSINPRGFTRGPRTIAGTIIFSMFDRESLREVQDKVLAYFQNAHGQYTAQVGNLNLASTMPRLLTDDLPPFDITITMANEYGRAAKMILKSVEVIDWGNTMGVDDYFIEETLTYMATDIIPLHPDAILTVPKVSN